MTDSPLDNPHDAADVAFAELVMRHLDGQLDAAGETELAEALRADDRRRRQFVRTCLHAEMLLERLGSQVRRDDQAGSAANDDGESVGMDESMVLPAVHDDPADDFDRLPVAPHFERPAPPVPLWRQRWVKLSAAAVFVLAATLAAWLGLRPAAPVGTFAVAVDAEWADRSAPAPQQGDRVRASDVFRLVRGVAKLRMDNGVIIVLEGPAELTVERAGNVRLANGRLSADVPVAGRGFAVRTPVTQIVDLGTSFGVSVIAGGRTDAVVFEGRITVAPPGRTDAAPQTLNAGAAVRVDQTSVAPLPAADAGRFVRVSDIDALVLAAAAPPPPAATAPLPPVVTLAKDPELLAYALFDGRADDALRAAGLPPSIAWRVPAGQAAVDPAPIAPRAGPVGGTIATEGLDNSVFLDLDATSAASSRLRTAGLLDAEGAIGADGHTVYLSWYAAPTALGSVGYGGLSLMDGDDRLQNEYLFFGRPTKRATYAAQVHRLARFDRPADFEPPVYEIDVDPSRPGVQPGGVDLVARRCVVKIEFRPGKDRVTFFLDPPAGTEPVAAALVVEDVDVRFDRLRLEAAGNGPWWFGKVLLGTTFRAVTAH